MAKSQARSSKHKPRRNAGSKRGGAAGTPAHLHTVWSATTATAALAWRNITATLFIAAVICLMAAYALGRGPLESRVASIRGEQIEPVFDWPDWMEGEGALLDPDVRPIATLASLVVSTVSADPFDRESLAQAAHKLKATGWLEGDTIVTRQPGGVITITGTWRVPAAVVEYGGESYLVGNDGAPMSLPFGASPGTHWYRIIAPALAPPTRPLQPDQTSARAIAWGEPWPGGDVQDGIALIRTLNATPELLKQTATGRIVDRIVAVDLSRYMRTESSELRLRTDLGGTIVWGAPVGQDAPGEVAVDVKLKNIALLLSRGERVDQPGVLVPVTGEVVTIDRTGGRG